MRVYLRDGLIGTDLHIKPTNTHQHLRMNSCHPDHCKASIPYSQALRLFRICSEEEHLPSGSENLSIYENGGIASSNWIKVLIKRLLYRVKIICNYNRTKISLLEYRWWSHTVPSNFTIFPINHQVPLTNPTHLWTATRGISISSFWRPRNLRDLLVWATLNATRHKTPGNRPCGAAGCRHVQYWRPRTNLLAIRLVGSSKWNSWPPVSPPTLFI